MERFNTIKKLIVAPALVIALTAGSAMAGPRDHFGGADRLGSAISDHIAIRPDAKQMAEYEPHFGQSGASSDQSQLGATRAEYPSIDDDVMGRIVYNPPEVSYLKYMLNQR